MRWNREKTAAALAALILAGGLWQVVTGLITPRPDIRVPDVALPEMAREISEPRPRRFDPESLPTRNPFAFSEGWSPLEPEPLPLPPLPGPALPLPRVGDAGADGPGAPGVAWVEALPAPEDEDAGADSGASRGRSGP